MNNNADFSNRPSWELVNPEILGNLFMAEKKFSIWFNQVKLHKADPKQLKEYGEWNTHFVTLFFNLKAHLLQSDKEEFQRINTVLEEYVSGKRDLSDDEKTVLLFKLIEFVKILGITNVEVPESQRHSLVYRS